MNIISSIQTHFSEKNTEHEAKQTDSPDTNVVIDTTFKLPIEYLDDKDVTTLSNVVSNDLELLNNSDEDNASMYELLLKPSNCFSKQTLPLWNQKYTTNTDFLTDTQKIIQNIQPLKTNTKSADVFDIETILPIWKDIKQNSFFHEKYNYLDWDMLKHLNESAPFLQLLSCIHLLSPMISFVLPIFILIFPFIILKIQGIPIDVNIYVNTLKNIAKNHTIGKILFNVGSLNWDKLVYLCFTIGIYVFQIYQNIILCKRFYTNIININKDLLFVKEYLQISINKMEGFVKITEHATTYQDFRVEAENNIVTLQKMRDELESLSSFNHSIDKLYSIGYMLRSYYILHVNNDYECALRYSVGFNGYIENLFNIHDLLCQGTISFAKFSENNDCIINNQYYPVITDNTCVKNKIDMNKNIIISAPNKAGKTTILKTTLINIIFTQQFGCGFYESATITPYKYIHSYLNIPDTSGRDSLFQAESRRCKEIIDTINEYKEDRHFCIFDELYSGTNPDEAIKSGQAFLQYLEGFKNVNFILTTHYKQICKSFKKSDKVCNYKMLVNINDDGTFEYTYKFIKGISKIKGGIRVLKDMQYPDEIINNIEK